MEEIIKLIVDNGIGVACVAYLIYFSSTTMKQMTATLEKVASRLSRIETKLDIEGDDEDE